MKVFRWYNFWSRLPGALYGFRAVHPTTGDQRIIFAYGGKTFQKYKERGKQHLWGGGRYNSEAKPWADTVLGWRQNGTIEEVIAAGGFFLIRNQTLISPFGLWWREIVFAIWLRRPYYNSQWNRHNPRRITQSEARRQRAARDQGIPYSGASKVGRAVGWWLSVRRAATLTLSALTVLVVVVMLLPGMPAGVVTLAVWDVLAHHRGELGAAMVAVGLAGWVTIRKPHRRKTKSRARRRRPL